MPCHVYIVKRDPSFAKGYNSNINESGMLTVKKNILCKRQKVVRMWRSAG
jgi:hypothetical protein